MASPSDSISMALFCDFENVALGVRDAQYEKFDIKPILERLLLKGSIVVKKAYCDWERYKGFKATMHEANFELIEIPHVRQSGKNSADIRLVVDALDLCYTKSHVNTFVIISGDSDFSPLVSKLRENAKYVIGVGVKQSTSDLLIANCDEFIFYDDLVRESQRKAARRDPKAAPPMNKHTPEELEAKRSKLAPPPLYTVVLLNDDFTPMDFVVLVLQKFFSMDRERAMQIMLKVHMEGRGVCGIYPRDIAATKVEQVSTFARENQHPLACVMEEN